MGQKKKDTKEVKVVDEVVEETTTEEVVEETTTEETTTEETTHKDKGGVVALTQRTATFEDGTTIRITRSEHSQIVNGTYKG